MASTNLHEDLRVSFSGVKKHAAIFLSVFSPRVPAVAPVQSVTTDAHCGTVSSRKVEPKSLHFFVQINGRYAGLNKRSFLQRGVLGYVSLSGDLSSAYKVGSLLISTATSRLDKFGGTSLEGYEHGSDGKKGRQGRVIIISRNYVPKITIL